MTALVFETPSRYLATAIRAAFLLLVPLLMSLHALPQFYVVLMQECPAVLQEPVHYMFAPIGIIADCSIKPQFIYSSKNMISLAEEESRFGFGSISTFQPVLWADSDECYTPPFFMTFWSDTKLDAIWSLILSVHILVREMNTPIWTWLFYEPWEPMLLFATALYLWLRAPLSGRKATGSFGH